MILKRKLRTIYSRIVIKTYSKMCPIEGKVLFSSFWGKQYSDNTRAISEKLHELYPEIQQVWFLRNTNDPYHIIPDYIRIVSSQTEYYKELATSFCFVTNENLPESIIKRNNQYFIQTWHGDRGVKKILYEAWEDGKRPTPVMDEFYTDLCVAGSDFGVTLFRNGFHYQGEIILEGCPRNDILVNDNPKTKEIIRERLNIKQSKNILLFAPTFRDNGNMDKAIVNIGAVLKQLNESGEWICLTRLHPMDKSAGLLKGAEGCVDVTDYPDMADLLLVADMLITDYSSSAPDYALTGRPVILATFDREDYSSSSREFKVPIDAPGFLIADNQAQLMELISKLNTINHRAISKSVLSYYGAHETGRSSEEVCKKIHEVYLRFLEVQ